MSFLHHRRHPRRHRPPTHERRGIWEHGCMTEFLLSLSTPFHCASSLRKQVNVHRVCLKFPLHEALLHTLNDTTNERDDWLASYPACLADIGLRVFNQMNADSFKIDSKKEWRETGKQTDKPHPSSKNSCTCDLPAQIPSRRERGGTNPIPPQSS